MAVKNTKLGGTDWVSEELASADLNDTTDEVVDGLMLMDSMTQDTTEYTKYDAS